MSSAITPPLVTPGAGPAEVASGLIATLPAAPAAVRRAAFTRLRHGDVAGVDALAVDTGLTGAAVREALAALVGTGAAALDVEGQVVAVGGLSVVPAAHELLLDGRQFWTWCAFDAIGIPAALGVDALARTRCGHCDARLEVTVTEGHPPTDRPVVGWLPGQACTNVQADFCPAANLFCDTAHLTTWRVQVGDPMGWAATLPELAGLGAQVWSEMAGTNSLDHGGHR